MATTLQCRGCDQNAYAVDYNDRFAAVWTRESGRILALENENGTVTFSGDWFLNGRIVTPGTLVITIDQAVDLVIDDVTNTTCNGVSGTRELQVAATATKVGCVTSYEGYLKFTVTTPTGTVIDPDSPIRISWTNTADSGGGTGPSGNGPAVIGLAIDTDPCEISAPDLPLLNQAFIGYCTPNYHTASPNIPVIEISTDGGVTFNPLGNMPEVAGNPKFTLTNPAFARNGFAAYFESPAGPGASPYRDVSLTDKARLLVGTTAVGVPSNVKLRCTIGTEITNLVPY